MGRLQRASAAAAAATAALAAMLVAGLLPPSGTAHAAQADAAPAAPVAPLAPTFQAWAPIPSYEAAKTDHPAIYLNGCNADSATVTPRVCTMLNPSAARTVLLFGDSHAAAWYGAVIGSAKKHGWRVRTLTKSGCSPLSMPIRRYKSTTTYTECGVWRTRALDALASGAYGRVDVVVISSWQMHDVLSAWTGGTRLTGQAKHDRWETALRTTLRKVLGSGKQVVVLRDAPQLPFHRPDAQACFARWGSEAALECGAPYSMTMSAGIWRAEQAASASFPSRVRAVDLTTMQCPGSWCGPLWGRYLMFKDDNHWTQTYVRVRLTAPLDAVLVPAMTRANP